MRLIRKDYAQDIVINESEKHSGFEFCYKPVYDKITDCVEVDAIPIEFIEKIIGQYDDWNEDTETLIDLIEKWKKEKENGEDINSVRN